MDNYQQRRGKQEEQGKVGAVARRGKQQAAAAAGTSHVKKGQVPPTSAKKISSKYSQNINI